MNPTLKSLPKCIVILKVKNNFSCTALSLLQKIQLVLLKLNLLFRNLLLG